MDFLSPLSSHKIDLIEKKSYNDCKAQVFLFCVALTDYFKLDIVNLSTNRLEESLRQFGGLVNDTTQHVFLVLSKPDQLEEYVKKHPLGKYFPEYNGETNFNSCCNRSTGDNSVKSIIHWIREKFLKLCHKNKVEKVTTFVVNLHDTGQVKILYNHVFQCFEKNYCRKKNFYNLYEEAKLLCKERQTLLQTLYSGKLHDVIFSEPG